MLTCELVQGGESACDFLNGGQSGNVDPGKEGSEVNANNVNNS